MSAQIRPDLSTAIGVLAALAGLAMVVDAGLAVGLRPAFLLLVAVALLALFQGLRAVVGAARGGVKQAETPAVEQHVSLPAAGDDFDDLLRDLASRRAWGGEQERVAISRRLQRAAVAVLTERAGLRPPEARRRLREGTWTDDPYAAAFFAADRNKPSAFMGQLRRSLSLEPTFNKQARHVVSALAARADTALAGGEPEVGDTPPLEGAPPARVED